VEREKGKAPESCEFFWFGQLAAQALKKGFVFRSFEFRVSSFEKFVFDFKGSFLFAVFGF
jgi:hypothetical protein